MGNDWEELRQRMGGQETIKDVGRIFGLIVLISVAVGIIGGILCAFQ